MQIAMSTTSTWAGQAHCIGSTIQNTARLPDPVGTAGLGLRLFTKARSHTAGRPTKNDFWLKSAERRDIEFATN